MDEVALEGVEVEAFVEHPIGERAEDRLLVQMQGVIAEYERAKSPERTRRGRMHKVASRRRPVLRPADRLFWILLR
jgi:site-specific DNA recombinase